MTSSYFWFCEISAITDRIINFSSVYIVILCLFSYFTLILYILYKNLCKLLCKNLLSQKIWVRISSLIVSFCYFLNDQIHIIQFSQIKTLFNYIFLFSADITLILLVFSNSLSIFRFIFLTLTTAIVLVLCIGLTVKFFSRS